MTGQTTKPPWSLWRGVGHPPRDAARGPANRDDDPFTPVRSGARTLPGSRDRERRGNCPPRGPGVLSCPHGGSAWNEAATGWIRLKGTSCTRKATWRADTTSGPAFPLNRPRRRPSRRSFRRWGQRPGEVADLLTELAARRTVPPHLVEGALELDKAYIPARYPNAHPSGAPRTRYTRAEAVRLIEHARAIIEFSAGLLSEI